MEWRQEAAPGGRAIWRVADETAGYGMRPDQTDAFTSNMPVWQTDTASAVAGPTGTRMRGPAVGMFTQQTNGAMGGMMGGQMNGPRGAMVDGPMNGTMGGMMDGVMAGMGVESLPDLPSDLAGAPVHTVDPRALQEALVASEGRFTLCWFLIGTNMLRGAMGILENVGNSFLTLRDPCSGVRTTFDLYSLKAWSAYPEGVPDVGQYCRTRLFSSGVFGAFEF